jgi:transposase
MSGDRTTPRFEVVASTRRSWSWAQKRGIIAEIVGEATLSQVARRHGIHTSLLFRWRRDLGTEPTSTTAARDARRETAPMPAAGPPARPALSFVPVMLSSPVASAPAPKPTLIEIVLAGGRTVRVGVDVDAAALVRIIAALEGHAEGVRENGR